MKKRKSKEVLSGIQTTDLQRCNFASPIGFRPREIMLCRMMGKRHGFAAERAIHRRFGGNGGNEVVICLTTSRKILFRYQKAAAFPKKNCGC
jgi:hypothetical protein